MSNLSLGEMITGALQSSQLYQAANATKIISPSILLVSQVVVPANPDRRGLIIYNNGANSVYLTYGPVSVSAACTRILATFAQWEMMGPVIYTGQISAIRNAGAGTLIITELT